MRHGGFAAVVNLSTGAVTRLAERVSLAYHNPGCGSGENAVLSRLEVPAQGPARTWLGRLDLKGKVRLTAVRTPGQLTSAMPYHNGLLAAHGYSIVSIDGKGRQTTVARTEGTPYRVLADGPDAVAFQITTGPETSLNRLAAGRVTRVATVPTGSVKLRPGAGGGVFAIGGRAKSRVERQLPSSWRAIDAPPDSDISTTGSLVVVSVGSRRASSGSRSVSPTDGRSDPLRISTKLSNGAKVDFGLVPSESAARRSRTAGMSSAAAAAPDHSTTTTDPDRACAVPRNDPLFRPTSRPSSRWSGQLISRSRAC